MLILLLFHKICFININILTIKLQRFCVQISFLISYV